MHFLAICPSLMDENEQVIVEHARTERDKITTVIKNETSFWQWAFEEWQANRPGRLKRMIEFNNFIYHVDIDDINTQPEVLVHVYDQKRAKEGKKFADNVFREEGLTPAQKENNRFPIELLADRLNIESLKPPFQIKQDFNPRKVTDAIGTGIDLNIMELVRLMNMIGIKTRHSCGGHKLLGKMNPSLDFSLDQLEQVLALMLAWNQAGGLSYEIIPYDLCLCAEVFYVQAPLGVSTKEAQNDLDNLTDFLESKLESFENIRFSLPELIHQKRRRLKKWLKEKFKTD